MLRKKNFLVVITLLLLVLIIAGCNISKPIKGIIKGRVLIPPEAKVLTRDMSGWVPVANAVVTVVDADGKSHSVTTDKDGYYSFGNIAVKANTVVTATVKVDGKTMVLKTVIDKAVGKDQTYDSKSMTPESTALALVVENLLKEGAKRETIDLKEIEKSDSFDNLVEQIAGVLEDYGNVTDDDDVEGLIDEVTDEVTTTTTALTSINISGQRIVGETLTASILPVGATVTYQWMISSTAAGTYTNITGATQSTYTLADATAGKYIKVKATGTGNYTGTVTSVALGPILIPITGVAITGSAVIGQELTATPTPSGATVSYQWMKSDTEGGTYTNIPGATDKNYPLVADDEDKYIKVKITGKGDYTGTVTSDVVGPVVTAEVAEAKAAIKPNWEIDNVEGVYEQTLPDGVGNADYKLTIKTSYDNLEAAKASGRTVTTYFTIPEGVTVWYPFVNADNQLEWKSTENGDSPFVLGMEGHPLSDDNIDADGVAYVALGYVAGETEFAFTIKLVDAAEDWEDVEYGNQTLTVTRSEYEFEVTSKPDVIYAVGRFGENATDKITIVSDDGILNTPGSKSLEALKMAIFSAGSEVNLNGYKIQVELKPTTIGDFGHTNRNLMIKELGVKDENNHDASDKVKVYLYAYTQSAWYDLVKCKWGQNEDGRGFNQGANETNELFAYVFASEEGTYTITFEAIDIDNNDAVICQGRAEISVIASEP